MNKENKSESNLEFFDDEINIKPFINTIFREKFLIFCVTAITTTFSIFYANSLKPIYRGGFEILVTDESKQGSGNLSLEGLISGSTQGDGKTQELILKSPSVLNPIYNFLLNEYENQGKSNANMTYERWLKNYIDIKFKEDSKILSVTFKNSDKELIITTLNKISKKYQDFSKSDKEKELKKTIKFLEEQEIIYKEKALKSLKKLNKFSIDNRIGDIDGFVTLSKNTSELATESPGILSPGQRFKNQFGLLEQYESKYTDLSNKLKSNSKTLTELKSKIENLRSALKRPNEILVTYRELAKNAQFQENIYNSIIQQLIVVKIEQARQLEPWQLISDPTVEKRKIAPHKAKIAAIGFLLSLISTSLLVLLYEKLKGDLYELKDIQNLLSCKYLDSISSLNLDLNSLIVENRIKKLITKNDSKIGLILLKDSGINFLNNLNTKIDFEILKNFDFSDENRIQTYDNLFIFIESGKTNISLIKEISKYMTFNEERFNGWFFIERN